MSAVRMRIMFGAIVLSAASGVGLLLTPTTVSSQPTNVACEFNLCDVGGSGNCFLTDVSWQCKETMGGCEAVYCNVE